jgi:NADPH-dependent glutamate synthase beta subunit-like oxidoreductase
MTYHVEIPDADYWKDQVKCQSGCPISTDSGRYVQLIAQGKYEEAYLVARSPNPFASVCGRVCAAPCEDLCRRGSIDAPVSIRALKRFVTERYGPESLSPDTQLKLLEDGKVESGNKTSWHLPVLSETRRGVAKGRKVAVIGAGPAGLSCAHDLALMGYQVTVFEATGVPGGMMRHGIPEYRLPRSVIEKEVEKILDLGVELKLNSPLTREFGLRELRDQGYESIFLSVGVQKGRDLNVEGTDLDGVIKAVDYLLNINNGYRVNLGKRVIVIGGGFVAFDAARTALRGLPEEERIAAEEEFEDSSMAAALDAARLALRGGAAEVHMVSLEAIEEMPVMQSQQGKEEFEEAKKEGILFHPRWGPKRMIGNGRVKAIELMRVTRVFDEDGRFSPQYDPSTTEVLETDSVILAIGQVADLSFLKPEDGVELTPGGTIKIDPATLATSAPGVFAGGDVAFGPRVLIDAIANGKRAALSIDQYLRGVSSEPTIHFSVEKIPTREYRMFPEYEKCDRQVPPTIPLERRTGISEVEVGYDETEARKQAERCLVCHIQTIYDGEKCILCNRCVDVCPEYCLKLVPLEELDLDEETRQRLLDQYNSNPFEQISAMIKDDEACIRCGLCAIRCPTDAMTMELFYYEER